MSVSPPEPPTEPQNPSHWAFMGGLCRCLFILLSHLLTPSSLLASHKKRGSHLSVCLPTQVSHSPQPCSNYAS